MTFDAEYQAGIDLMKATLRQEFGPDIDVYDTDEMQSAFATLSFTAPFITVIRRSDNVKGTLQFTRSPRVYYKFIPE